jgi:hypothetical protein
LYLKYQVLTVVSQPLITISYTVSNPSLGMQVVMLDADIGIGV